MPKFRLRHAFVAVMITLAMLAQGTWALAGTTGNITGTVTDSTNGKAIADAKVTVVSPSQSGSATTDAGGHFTILNLMPDTYTVSVEKDGFTPISVAGVTVFADQTQTLALTTQPQLKTIARVTSRAAGSLVKSGVTGDIYNVTSGTMQAAGALGGGTNLDNAYSAIASVPGVVVPVGGAGWNQATYIRGSQSFFAGYEYDGVPVNRAFDNYNSSTESNLGLQELQVYTGGGPASNSSSGTSGFINQVIKTGTYPGFGMITGGISAPMFNHSLRVEAGGASPSRNFSYYVGLSGYDSALRVFNDKNGADLAMPNGVFGSGAAYTVTDNTGVNGRGDLPLCNSDGSTPGFLSGQNGLLASLPWYATDGYAGTPGYGAGDTCFFDLPSAFTVGDVSGITDRENVVNFHFGIPRHDGQRDDIQLLWSASAMNTLFYSSMNDSGGNSGVNLNDVMLAVAGGPYCPATPTATTSPYCGTGANYFSAPGITYPSYVDAPGTYNLPFGTQVCSPASNTAGYTCLPTETYLQPSSNTSRAALAALPNDLRDSFRNDTGIIKAQWTHPLSSNAYVRLFGYTFFSDWTQAGAASAWSDYVWGIGGPTAGAEAANYDLITHTGGGELQFTDQLSPQHLLQFTANYTTANTMRFNNYGYVLSYFFGGSPIGLISKDGSGTYHCYDPTSGAEEPCKPYGSWESFGPNPSGFPGAGTAAGNAGANWVSLWNGDASGPRNTVTPKFGFASLTDEWRPSDKLDINLGLRLDRYQYDMGNPADGTEFYAQIIKNDLCVNSAGTVYTSPLKPGQPPPAKPIYTQTCPAGYAHPNFSAQSPASYTLTDLSPRLGITYTQSPGTVWRASVGRFTEPPISASTQYLGASGDATSVWAATLPLGFLTPFHPIPMMSATQADLSFEHQFRNTDWAVKISPFFNSTQGYQVQSFIGPNFVTQAPVGQFRSEGVEFALTKGDFNREGLSGMLSATFTNAKMQYQQKYFNVNQINTINTVIAQYNSLTSACGSNTAPSGIAPGSVYNNGGVSCIAGETPASACYLGGAASSCSVAGAVTNPYYNKPAQALLDPNGWYAPGDVGLSPTNNAGTTYYDSPFNSALILNYRHDRFTITPSFQLTAGPSYGGPMDVVGVDPRACAQNSAQAGITAVSPNTDPNQCDYLSAGTNGATYAQSPMLYVPNPDTGKFEKPGAFRNPWMFLANLQLAYDISPKVKATLTLANIYHHCFGGSSEPWTKGWSSPSNYVCGYGGAGVYYTSNFYNGTSPSDQAANGLSQAPYPWQTQPYNPMSWNDAGYSPAPFNAYLQLQIKL